MIPDDDVPVAPEQGQGGNGVRSVHLVLLKNPSGRLFTPLKSPSEEIKTPYKSKLNVIGFPRFRPGAAKFKNRGGLQQNQCFGCDPIASPFPLVGIERGKLCHGADCRSGWHRRPPFQVEPLQNDPIASKRPVIAFLTQCPATRRPHGTTGTSRFLAASRSGPSLQARGSSIRKASSR